MGNNPEVERYSRVHLWKKALNLQQIARKGFSVVLVSLRCPEKHIKSLQKYTPPKFEKNLLEFFKKMYI